MISSLQCGLARVILHPSESSFAAHRAIHRRGAFAEAVQRNDLLILELGLLCGNLRHLLLLRLILLLVLTRAVIEVSPSWPVLIHQWSSTFGVVQPPEACEMDVLLIIHLLGLTVLRLALKVIGWRRDCRWVRNTKCKGSWSDRRTWYRTLMVGLSHDGVVGEQGMKDDKRTGLFRERRQSGE